MLTKEVYDLVVQHLRDGTRPSADERRQSSLQWKVCRYLCNKQFELKRVYEPRSKTENGMEMTLVLAKSNKIVLSEDKVQDLVKYCYDRSKGANAKKLFGLISKHFCGVSESNIQSLLSNLKQAQSLHPMFHNKAPLVPITASKVQERNQLDLVDFSDLPVEVDEDGFTYKYVLSVLAVFSR